MTHEKESIEHESLTPMEIEFIKRTWGKVGNSVEMAIDFYNRLFYLYPALRPLFKEDIRLQSRKFTAHLSYLIKNIQDWNNIQADIEELGKRHASYEVRSQHYNFVKESLFYSLKTHLSNDWTESTEIAWNKFYKLVADRMMSFHHQQE